MNFGISHFGRKVNKILERKGMHIYGLQALPDANGSFLNSTTGYLVNDNGCGRVWTYQDVLKAAQERLT